jgi:hypothetical protein
MARPLKYVQTKAASSRLIKPICALTVSGKAAFFSTTLSLIRICLPLKYKNIQNRKSEESESLSVRISFTPFEYIMMVSNIGNLMHRLWKKFYISLALVGMSMMSFSVFSQWIGLQCVQSINRQLDRVIEFNESTKQVRIDGVKIFPATITPTLVLFNDVADNLNANQISINRGNGKMTNSLNPVIYDCAVLNKRF